MKDFAQGGLLPTAHLTSRERQGSQATYVRLNRVVRSDAGSIAGFRLVSLVFRAL